MVERNLIGPIVFQRVIQLHNVGSILRELIGRSIAANYDVPWHLWVLKDYCHMVVRPMTLQQDGTLQRFSGSLQVISVAADNPFGH
jgi:hypothetical protein